MTSCGRADPATDGDCGAGPEHSSVTLTRRQIICPPRAQAFVARLTGVNYECYDGVNDIRVCQRREVNATTTLT
jgi:hypothetical protein